MTENTIKFMLKLGTLYAVKKITIIIILINDST